MSVYEKYNNNEKLTIDDVRTLLQCELFELEEIWYSLDVSDPEGLKAGHKAEAIRFAMELIQRT